MEYSGQTSAFTRLLYLPSHSTVSVVVSVRSCSCFYSWGTPTRLQCQDTVVDADYVSPKLMQMNIFAILVKRGGKLVVIVVPLAETGDYEKRILFAYLYARMYLLE